MTAPVAHRTGESERRRSRWGRPVHTDGHDRTANQVVPDAGGPATKVSLANSHRVGRMPSSMTVLLSWPIDTVDQGGLEPGSSAA